MVKFYLQEIRNNLRKFKLVLLTLFFAGVFADVFFLHFPSDWRFLFLIILWAYLTKLYKFRSVVTFKITLVFLGALLISFIFLNDIYSNERIATWIYLFLIFGLVQQFKELKLVK